MGSQGSEVFSNEVFAGCTCSLVEMLCPGSNSQLHFPVIRSILKAPYSSKIGILLSKKGLIN